MSMLLRVNGSPFDNFLSGSVNIRLDVLCNTFSFVMVRSETDPLPFKLGDACEVLVNDVKVLTGVIEAMTIDYDQEDHRIELVGRDTTSDLLDSSMLKLSDLGKGITLKAIIEKVISNIGSKIKVIDNANPDSFNSVNDLASPEPGKGAFEFVEKLARQRQVLLTSDADGNVVITQNSGKFLDGAKVQNTIANNQDNNVINATASYDNTKRFRRYVLSSQANVSALDESSVTSLETIIDREGVTFDRSLNVGRQLVIAAEAAYAKTDDFNRVRWEANLRKARGNLYTAEFYQFSVDGDPNNSNIWEANKLVKVVDDFVDINANLLINSITFSLDISSGSKSVITFVEPDAYTLALEEPVMGSVFK